jgi:Spy/CpxP family protein refolding chaperone
MKTTIRKTALVASALVIGTAAALALAHGGPGYGPGYGGGTGYGPGMMGAGPGHGPGMMSGGGPGYGPGRGHAQGASLPESLNLTDEQREKILAIQEGNRQKNWTAMGQLRSEMFSMRRMYDADKVDANAIAEQHKKVDELRRLMLKSRLESHNQVEAVLTPEQRKQFRQVRPQWLQEGEQ